MKLKLFSPAKVNLFLRVMGRREDGYHNLASLFQSISLGDILELEISDKDHLECTYPGIPIDRTNLIWKAVDLFKRITGLQFNLRIHLDKKIPPQSGLGGGSSNAATTLWGLNSLFGHPLSEDDLCAFAAEIGSDISFFFSSGTAFCTGRGEQVRSLPSLNREGWIVKPKEGLSTPLVFSKLSLKECLTAEPEDLLNSFYEKKPLFHNDLERPAFHILPLLQDMKNELLQKGCEAVTLSGSGTAFYCEASEAPQGFQAIKVHFITRSPTSWYSF